VPDKLKVICPNCGATNNFPLDAQGKKVVCGRCREALPNPGRVIEPSAEEAYRLFGNLGLPTLIDFYSPTCAPCQIMHPVLERLAERRKGEIMVVKINVERHPEIASDFAIKGVPTFVILRKGHERDRISGAMSEADFSLWVASRA